MSLKDETVTTLRRSVREDYMDYMQDVNFLNEPREANHSDDSLKQGDFLQCIKKGNALGNSNRDDAPWCHNSRYFTSVAISRLACMKTLEHALRGGNMEVMGMLIGFTMNDRFVIFDSFELPVEGTETRVNAQTESYEYMVQYVDEMVPENQNIVGWYHSHPGYDCWLSSIDMHTQQLNQNFQDPYVAIVVDPHKSINEGKIRIGAFRTVQRPSIQGGDDNNCDDNNNNTNNNDNDNDNNELEFYELQVSIFESKYDGSWDSHKLRIATPKFDPLSGNLLMQRLLENMKQWAIFNELIGETQVDQKGNARFKKENPLFVKETEHSLKRPRQMDLSRIPIRSNSTLSIISNENESDLDMDNKHLGGMDSVGSSIHTMTDHTVPMKRQIKANPVVVPRRILSHVDNFSIDIDDEGQALHNEALKADYIANKRKLLGLKLKEYQHLKYFRDTFTDQTTL